MANLQKLRDLLKIHIRDAELSCNETDIAEINQLISSEITNTSEIHTGSIIILGQLKNRWSCRGPTSGFRLQRLQPCQPSLGLFFINYLHFRRVAMQMQQPANFSRESCQLSAFLPFRAIKLRGSKIENIQFSEMQTEYSQCWRMSFADYRRSRSRLRSLLSWCAPFAHILFAIDAQIFDKCPNFLSDEPTTARDLLDLHTKLYETAGMRAAANDRKRAFLHLTGVLWQRLWRIDRSITRTDQMRWESDRSHQVYSDNEPGAPAVVRKRWSQTNNNYLF